MLKEYLYSTTYFKPRMAAGSPLPDYNGSIVQHALGIMLPSFFSASALLTNARI